MGAAWAHGGCLMELSFGHLRWDFGGLLWSLPLGSPPCCLSSELLGMLCVLGVSWIGSLNLQLAPPKSI